MVQSTPLLQLPGAHIPRSGRPQNSSQMTLIVALAIVAALYFAREVLIPLTLAVLLAIILAPLVSVLRRLRIGRVTAVLLAVAMAIGVICAIGGLIGTQIAELADNIPAYAQRIETKAADVRSYVTDEVGHAVSRLGYSAAPVAGKNSFTEGEVRDRLEKHGYTAVSGLMKDDQSIWRGTAMKDGKSVAIAVDYQGNIVAK